MKKHMRLFALLLAAVLALGMMLPAALADTNDGTGGTRYPQGTAQWTDKDKDIWTMEIEVTSGTQPYWIQEDLIPGYKSIFMDGPVSIGTSREVDIQNEAEQAWGSLRLTKIVNPAPAAADEKVWFTFDIELSGTTISTTDVQAFGDVTFKGGKTTVKLGHEDTLEIERIPLPGSGDVTYTITERPMAGYTTPAYTQTGKLNESEPDGNVAYVNRKIPLPERHPVDVELKKVVTGNGDRTVPYDFTAQFTNLDPGATYYYSGDVSGSFKANEKGNGQAFITLGDNQTVTFAGIPATTASSEDATVTNAGATYQFSEASGNWRASYTVVDAKNLGKILSPANGNAGVKQTLSTAAETAEDGEEVTVTFTNDLYHTTQMALSKKVALGEEAYLPTAEELEQEFTFTVDFAGVPEGKSIAISGGLGVGTAKSDGHIIFERTLRAGELMTFTDIPDGATYSVKESPTEGYSGKVQLNNGDAEEKLNISDIHAVEKQVNQVAFTNTPDTQKLQVSKQVYSDSAAELNADYDFTLWVDTALNAWVGAEGGNRSAVVYAADGTSTPCTLTFAKAQSGEGYEATFKLGNGETLELALLNGAQYKIKETAVSGMLTYVGTPESSALTLTKSMKAR